MSKQKISLNKKTIAFILIYLLVFIVFVIGIVLSGVGGKAFSKYVEITSYYASENIPMSDWPGLVSEFNNTVVPTGDKLYAASIDLFVPGIILLGLSIIGFIVAFVFQRKLKSIDSKLLIKNNDDQLNINQ